MTARQAMAPPASWFATPRAPARTAITAPASVVLDARPGVSPHKRVEFVRLRVPDLDAHRLGGMTRLGHEAGITLLDFDGDGDLDLFVGSTEAAVPACVYRNDSEPGAMQFRRVGEWCLDAIAPAATAIDLDEDGAHELVALSTDGPWVLSAVSGLQPLPVHASFSTPCDGLTALPFDLDRDGDLDLAVACLRTFSDAPGNLVWLREGNELRPLDRTGSRAFVSDGTIVTLGLGALDVDRDGLVDLVEVNDSFSTRGRWNSEYQPGGVRFGCPPASPCDARPVPFAAGVTRWGSFMGMGNLRVVGEGEALVLSDWGPVRLVAPRDVGFVDLDAGNRGFPNASYASPLAARLGFSDGRIPVFSWGLVVDDFDGDGRDDVLVVEGALRELGNDGVVRHQMRLVLQVTDGGFATVSAGSGFDEPAAPGLDSGRAALSADLDADGWLDVVVAPGIGPPRIFAAVRPTQLGRRCTLVPRPSVVPTWGYGYTVVTGRTGPSRWAVQGQSRSTAAPWITAPEQRGTLVFPSGRGVAFDCGDGPGPVDVVEPDWLSLEFGASSVAVRIDGPGSVTGAGTRTADGTTRRVAVSARDNGTWRVDVAPGAVDVMLQIDGSWVGRWFSRPE